MLPSTTYAVTSTEDEGKLNLTPSNGYEVSGYSNGEIIIRDSDGHWKDHINYRDGEFRDPLPEIVADDQININVTYEVSKNGDYYKYYHHEEMNGESFNQLSGVEMKTDLVTVSPNISFVDQLSDYNLKLVPYSKESLHGHTISLPQHGDHQTLLASPQKFNVILNGMNSNSGEAYHLTKVIDATESLTFDLQNELSQAEPVQFNSDSEVEIRAFMMFEDISSSFHGISANQISQFMITPNHEVELSIMQDNQQDVTWNWVSESFTTETKTELNFSGIAAQSNVNFDSYQDTNNLYSVSIEHEVSDGEFMIDNVHSWNAVDFDFPRITITEAETGEIVEEISNESMSFQYIHVEDIAPGQYEYELDMPLPNGERQTYDTTFTVGEESDSSGETLELTSIKNEQQVNTNTLNITGTTSPNSIVNLELFNNGTKISEQNVTSTGSGSFEGALDLQEDGNYTLKATLMGTDIYQEVQFTKDTVAPSQPEVDVNQHQSNLYINWDWNRDIDHYNILVGDSESTLEVVENEYRGSSYELDNFNQGGKFYVKVVAFDEAGNKSSSIDSLETSFYQTAKLYVEDQNGSPITGTYVSMEGTDDQTDNSYYSGFTNEEGLFENWNGAAEITGIAAGTYEATVHSNGKEPYTTTVTIDETSDYVTTPINITLEQPEKETTTVTFNVYGEGEAIDELDYAHFYSWDVQDQYYDDSGDHTFRNEPLDDGQLTVTDAVYDENYSLYINEEGYIPYRQSNINLNETVTQNVYLEKGADLSGTISTSDDKQVSGIELTFVDDTNGYRHGEADVNGNFLIEDVKKGNGTLELDVPGYQQKEVAITSADFDSKLTIEVEPEKYVHGRVLDGDGNPVARASISLVSDNYWGGWTRTDENGYFKLRDVKDATYSLNVYGSSIPNVTKENVTPSTEELTIVAAENAGNSSFSGEGNQLTASKQLVTPGKKITYRLNVQNNGSAKAENVDVNLNMDDQLSLQSSALWKGQEVSLTNGSYTIPSMKAGESGTLVFEATVDSNASKPIVTSAKVKNENTLSATTNLLFVTLEGPSVTSNKSVKLYGNAKAGSIVEIYDGEQKLASTEVNGRWWYSNVNLPVEGNTESTHHLRAKVMDGGEAIYSEPLKVDYKPNVPEVQDVTLNAGWNNNVKLNPYTGILTSSIVEYTPINLDIEFDQDVDNGAVTFLGEDYELQAKDGTGNYQVQIPDTWSSYGEEMLGLTFTSNGEEVKLPLMEVIVLIDPSGYVFEGSMENRLDGVKAVVQEQQDDSSWKFWNAANFGQVNPQITDENGRYGWDVPAGNWRVLFSKDGYVDYTSRETLVPPPETQLNVPMIAVTNPEVTSVTPNDGVKDVDLTSNIEVNFDRPMNENNMGDNIKLLNSKNEEVSVTLELENMNGYQETETGYFEEDPSVKLSDTVIINPDEELAANETYTVKVTSDVEDYDGKRLGTETTSSFTTGDKEEDNTDSSDGSDDSNSSDGNDSGSPVVRYDDNDDDAESDSDQNTLKKNKNVVPSVVPGESMGVTFEDLQTSDIERFTSSNSEIATINEDGELQANGEGILVVTAETKDGEKHHKLVVLSDGDTKKWNAAPTVMDKRKEWTVTFNQPLNKNFVNSEQVQVINEQGEAIDVELKMDGSKLKVVPTADYEEGKYYLYISNKIATESPRKLKEGIVMSFRIE